MPAFLNENERQLKAKQIVLDYILDWIQESGRHLKVTIDDIYIVRYVGILQNWSCLIGTMLPDGTAYELTYNGDQREYYLDVYKKFENIVITDKE